VKALRTSIKGLLISLGPLFGRFLGIAPSSAVISGGARRAAMANESAQKRGWSSEHQVNGPFSRLDEMAMAGHRRRGPTGGSEESWLTESDDTIQLEKMGVRLHCRRDTTRRR